MIVKNILKKVFVFLVLSASFLTLNSKDTFANVVSEQNEIASKLVRNVKEVGNDRYYKGDFYSDVGTYPEGMFLVVEKLIENYIAFKEGKLKGTHLSNKEIYTELLDILSSAKDPDGQKHTGFMQRKILVD